MLVLPLLVLTAGLLAIWLAIFSRGPLLFTQERIGINGRPFRLYKFRTMRAGADPASHRAHVARLLQSGQPMQKLDSGRDVRLIPGAWWLRATGLDELPQILNILRGEMSLVGPRPCLPYEYEHYTPEQRRRLGCLPGLTGLWQVSGKNQTTFDEMVRLDIAYQRQRSFWLDLSIILRTVPAVLRQVLETRRSRRATQATHGGRTPSFTPATVQVER